MTKKKILFFAPSLAIGGAERVLVNLLKKIDTDKYEVSLCLFSYTGVYFNEIPSAINVFSIFKSNIVARSCMFLYRKYRFSLLIKIATLSAVKDKYDCGITFSDGLLTDVMLFAAKKIIKAVTWVHSCYISQSSLHRAYTPRKRAELINGRYSRINEIVCVSQTSLKEFEEMFGYSEKLSLIYNIFDSATVIEKSKESIDVDFENDIVNIIAVGRLVDVKEYSKLIKAAKILSGRGEKFKIRILGDGQLRNQLAEEIKENNLERVVELFGFVPNPYPYIKKSDILVITSSSEALPTIFIEAMMLEVSIVSTECSGAVEISDRGECALLSDHSVEDIAAKLEIMIAEPRLRKQFSEKAKKRVDYYDEKTVLEQVYQIFEK